MYTELISVPSPDGPLDGAIFRAGKGSSETAVNYLHGKTMNFYSGPARFLAEAVVAQGCDYVSVNRRGHDLASLRSDFAAPEGDAWATVDEHQRSTRAVLDWIGARYRRVILVGHSLGGWLAVWAAARAVANIRGVALLSPILRPQAVPLGDDEILEKAQALVAAGRGQDLIALPRWSWAVSAQSVVTYRQQGEPEMLGPLASGIEVPLLILTGEHETANVLEGIEQMRALRGHRDAWVSLARCNHFYLGRESDVQRIVGDFVAELV